MLSTSYVFIEVSNGLTKGFISLMLASDIYVVLLTLLGVDRSLFIVTTRIGSITITILPLFLPIRTSMIIYVIIKSELLKEIWAKSKSFTLLGN